MKNLTINLDDVEVSIDLKKIVDKEVEKRLKKAEPEFIINHGGRRQGNTYRILLYAQLLASDKSNQNIFVLAHNTNYAVDLFKSCANMAAMYGEGIIPKRETLTIQYPNNSRIWFASVERYDRTNNKACGLRNLTYLYD